MPGTEFKVTLKDFLSGGLAKMAGAGSGAFNSIAASAAKAKSTLNTLPQSIRSLKKDLDDLTRRREITVDRSQLRKLDSDIDKVEAKLRRLERPSPGGGGLMSMMPGGGAGLGALAGAGGLGMFLSGSMDNEMAKVKLGVLTGSPQEGDKLFEGVKNYAAASPYGKKDLLNAATLMKAFGVANQNVMPSLGMLSNVAGGDREKLQSLALAYSQSMSKGRLSGEDKNQMATAGFNPLAEISRTSGKSMPELEKMMEQGKISALDMVNAFKSATSEGGAFYQMAEKASKTTMGQWSTLKDNFMDMGTAIADKALPALNKLFSFAGVLMEYKESVLLLGLAWGGYAIYQNWATISSKLFTGSLITMRTALIATGIGAIAVVIGLLWNLYERTKNTTDGFNVLKNGVVSFGQTIKYQFLMMGEAMKYAMERFALSKGGKVLIGLGQLMTGNFKGGIATIQSIFNGEGESAQEELRTKYEGRIANLRGNQMEAWANTKSSFSKLYGKKESSTATGEIDPNAIPGGGAGGAGGLGALSDKADGVASSGPRSIIVNIGKFQDNLNLYSSQLNEGLDEIDRKITETLLRVVNSVAQVR